jgi:ATP-dependent exoDNAse (exonuclease V) alpha subunit
MTLCRFSNKFKDINHIKHLNIDYIFVDEISMVHEVYYKFLSIIKEILPKVKFIICGDFKQLPPVCDRVENCDYKNSHILYELSDHNRLTLSTCRRANDELFNICMNVDKVIKSDFGNKSKDFNLCYTNKKRIEINKKMMDKQSKKYGEGVKLPKNSKNPNSQDVELFEGMPIISMKTDAKIGIVNNEMFSIKSIYRDKIEITDGSKTIETDIDKFQYLFYVAYAITIHKSQGSTFDFKYSIHEWEKLDDTFKYVALSKSTKKNLINII